MKDKRLFLYVHIIDCYIMAERLLYIMVEGRNV